MTKVQYGALFGLLLAAIWAFAGVWWALLAVVLAAIGAVVGLVLEGRIDLAGLLDRHQQHR